MKMSSLSLLFLASILGSVLNGQTKGLLPMANPEAVGLDSKTEVCEFGTDDDDRIRGCYTSHISVLEKAEAAFAEADLLSMAAAVADWRPKRRLSGKWRHKDSGADEDEHADHADKGEGREEQSFCVQVRCASRARSSPHLPLHLRRISPLLRRAGARRGHRPARQPQGHPHRFRL